MIIPEGATVRLDPKDEFNHEPEPVSNYNESMYLHAFDGARRVGGWFRIGNRPNEGHAEMTCCLYLPDGRVGFMFAKPSIRDNEKLVAGGMAFEVVEPFRTLRLSYEGEVLLLDRPGDLADPGRAFKTNPRAPCSVALEVTGLSPMHGGELVKPDGSPLALDPETAVFRGHTEQHVAARGLITVGDLTFPIDGFGYRDKSWGPRHWQSFYWYKWLPVTFGPDFGVVLQVMGRLDDTPFVNGAVFTDGRLVPITAAEIVPRYDADHYQTALTVDFSTAERAYRMTGEVLCLAPLRHRRTLPDGSETTSRITEGFTAYTCEGRTGWGMSEFLDLIVDGRPITVPDAAARTPAQVAT